NMLAVSAAVLDYGSFRISNPSVTLGGFAGGPESAPIVSVASFISAILAYRGQIFFWRNIPH
ncbi:MAG: hypothetical protein JSV20_05200, partial [Candidatus Bathyarchaeota archaeon]